jgi:hypothetical protein
LFSEGEFAKGKLLWLKEFPNLEVQNGMIDCYGTEDEFFFIKLRHLTETAFTSKCSKRDCTLPVTTLSGTIVAYCSDKDCTAKTLSGAVSHWMKSKGGKKGTKPNCSGVRKHSPRHFVNGLPHILPIEVSNCQFAITNTLQLEGTAYTLAGVTYSKRGHFISHIKTGIKGWILYDGLHGNKVTQSATAPPRCYESHCIYIKT